MKKIYILLGLLLLVALALLVWWKTGSSPVEAQIADPKIFVIENGQGVRAIAKNLKDEGLIRNQIVFFLITKRLGLDNKIEAGSYRLFPSMSAEDIAKELTHGTLDVWVTVPEGYRAGEIADLLSTSIPNYDNTWPEKLEKNEGYLFPDTYLIPRDADIDMIITIMRNNFDTKYDSLDNTSGRSKNQIVTIASLVEREARHDEDRPLVASVILNRFNIGMKLDIDATVQYILGYQENQKRWWKEGLTQADLDNPSPYNTYLNAGLPPTPIANPGIESLRAVINPRETDFIYYITDKSGTNRYAKTLAEHNANIKKYGL